MQPKIEELRKKAFMLYGGPDGVERVNREVKKTGRKEDDLNETELKMVLNNIIKNAFIDYVGLDKTKELLAKEVTHIPGYHRIIEEDKSRIHIISRINFMRWFVRFIILVIIALIVSVGYYTMKFNRVEYCGKKTNVAARDMCFTTLALRETNISVCDELSTRTKKYSCYGSVGIKLNDTKVCSMIPSDELLLMGMHDRCILCVAFNQGNRSLCTNFISPNREAECLHQLDRGYTLICEGVE